MTRSWFISLFLSFGIIADQLLKATLSHLEITQQELPIKLLGFIELAPKMLGGLYLDIIGHWGNVFIVSVCVLISLYWLFLDIFKTSQFGHRGPAVLLTGSLSNLFDLLTNERTIETIMLRLLNYQIYFSFADFFILLGLLLTLSTLIKQEKQV